MKTLIIVDPQNDFCPGGSLAVTDGDKIFPFINRIIPNYDLVIITKDDHPHKMEAFNTNHKDKQPFDSYINDQGEEDILWPEHCVVNTFGNQFHKDLNLGLIKNLYIFKKGLTKFHHPYSAFGAEGLDEFLKERNVKEIDISGLALDFCVLDTAIDSVKLGYDTSVILDLTKSISEEGKNNAIKKMKDNNINII